MFLEHATAFFGGGKERTGPAKGGVRETESPTISGIPALEAMMSVGLSRGVVHHCPDRGSGETGKPPPKEAKESERKEQNCIVTCEHRRVRAKDSLSLFSVFGVLPVGISCAIFLRFWFLRHTRAMYARPLGTNLSLRIVHLRPSAPSAPASFFDAVSKQ